MNPTHSDLSVRVHLPRVYSKRKGAEPPSADAVYVGRPTAFGNPFPLVSDAHRDKIVSAYREWIWQAEQAPLRARMRAELRGKDLVCWCAPLPCHADVILEVANQ